MTLSVSAREPAVPIAAEPLPLTAVRLTGGPLKEAQDADARYLLQLEPDRMMAGYRIRAGLEAKAEGYGGWDSVEGRQITGHIAGHYLSAVSLMHAATGDKEFKHRADDLVAEMKEVQEARGTGYIGAITDATGRDGGEIYEQEIAKGDIRSGGFDLNGMWAPWYVLHKTFAGLRDAYRHTGNPTALALEVGFARWAESILAPLNEAQVQKMLETEFGGMNEVLADLYEDTGDDRWLTLARRFEHHAITGPLKHHVDILPGKHGNAQVPKLIGSADLYAYAGAAEDLMAAGFFWDRVVHHHSFATGGHGKDEYFGPPDEFNDRVDGRTAESCNVYNMLKLTRRMFGFHPSARYAAFQERALFNHVLASIDPHSGRTCYMVPVGRGVEKEYADMFESFTCCVGSGMESHALHGLGVYFTSKDKLWVNVYAPTRATWAEAGVTLETATDLPEGESARITLGMARPATFTLALRKPEWAGEGFALRLNGEVPAVTETAGYLELKREWKNGDKIELTLPKTLRLEPLPDNPDRAAILWGPLVLAGDLGPERMERKPGEELQAVPVLVASGRPVSEWLKPVDGKPGTFRTAGVGRERDVELLPFYRLHHRTYAVYWDFYTPDDWAAKSAEVSETRKRQAELEKATIAFVQPGEMQPERDFHQQGEESSPVRTMGRPGRRASKWFSFELPVDAGAAMKLLVTYNRDEWRERVFSIKIDGRKLADETVKARGPQEFYTVEYPVPAEWFSGTKKATIKFQAAPDSETAAVYGIRLIRSE